MTYHRRTVRLAGGATIEPSTLAKNARAQHRNLLWHTAAQPLGDAMLAAWQADDIPAFIAAEQAFKALGPEPLTYEL